MTDPQMPGAGRSIGAVFGGSLLSFLAFGALWVGTPWTYQTLMAVPFFLLTWLLARGAPETANVVLAFVLTGAAPLGMLIMRFRDKNDSHLFPVLIVCAWVAGAAAGRLAARRA